MSDAMDFLDNLQNLGFLPSTNYCRLFLNKYEKWFRMYTLPTSCVKHLKLKSYP